MMQKQGTGASNRSGGYNRQLKAQGESEVDKLAKEFAVIDADGNGMVDRDEMDNYLMNQGINDEHRSQIVDELFEKLDKDANGRIEIAEFSSQYVSTKNQLVEREQEIKQSIMTNNTRLKQARQELEKAKRIHGNFIQGPMGVLHISVIRAENLHGVNSSHVVCYQGNKHVKTRPAKGQAPTYSDSELSFEVDDELTPLQVHILDIDRGQAVLEISVSFDDIKAEIVPQNEEFWLHVREGDPTAPKLRMKLTYEQNEVLKWNAEVTMLHDEIKNDAGILQQVRIFIDQLRTPFGFLSREVNAAHDRLLRQDKEEDEHQDHKYYEKEKEMVNKFDTIVGNLARQQGVETIPWLNITYGVVGIFLVLVLLQMFKRNCFLSLTVACVAIYVLEFPQTISRQTFRGLVLMVVLSWVYDFVQLFLIESSASEEDEEDGGNEYKLRRFTRLLTYITLLWKVIVVLVFWKDSHDFRHIIKGGQSSKEDDVDDIIAQFSDKV